MLLTTTGTIEGHQIERYLGIVSSEVVLGASAIKDMMAGFRDFFGGRSNSYERAFQETRETALRELEDRARALGADAVVGVRLDFQTVGTGGMMMVGATGTAVKMRS
ncbi:YbjQ family protein [Sphingobacterium multivorum]|uniref:YbjQ family protein n=1 Tax=Sphingobacterium multivorum TaxID=28454 RepID=UPI000E95B76F|nr:YbjQ family protein [Sphingobacterium multivorum]HBI88047.1 hypothetical protein [Sphingobacterium sp.]